MGVGDASAAQAGTKGNGGLPGLSKSGLRKVDMIFRNFDKDNNNYLDRKEMAALVVAVNPRVNFTEEQINAILDEVFRTYSSYIDAQRGLTIEGLRQTYADGAGDVDRDFNALGYKLDTDFDASGNKWETESRAAPVPSSIVIPITPHSTAPPTPMARSPPALSPGSAMAPAGARTPSPSGAPSSYAPSVRAPPSPPPPSSISALNANGPLAMPSSSFAPYADTTGRSSLRSGENRERDESGFVSNASSVDGIAYRNTHKFLSELDGILTREEEANWRPPAGVGGGSEDGALSTEEDTPPEVDKTATGLSKAVSELQKRVDRLSNTEEAFEGHMELGKALSDRGRLREALVSFTKAAQLKPSNVKGHFRCGNVLYRLKRLSEARDRYEKGLEAGKANPMIYGSLLPQLHVNLGIALEGDGMLLCACDHYREAAILNPNHFRALKLLGSALFGIGELDKAEQALEHAIFLRPSYADAHCDLGSTLHALGEEEKAKRMFQRSLELFPGHPNALYNYAGLLRDTGEFVEAANLYDRILKIDKRNWRALLNKAVALLGDKQHEEARAALKEAFRITNRVELYDAIRHLKRISRKNKELSQALANLPEQGTPGRDGELAYGGQALVVEVERFERASSKTTLRTAMAIALEVRAFQRHTRVCRFDVSKLRDEMKDSYIVPPATDKKVRKAVVEKIMRKLLSFLSAETFQGAMRAMNERVLSALDTKRNGIVDLGLFFALVAPLCGGTADERKRVAFHALVWRSDKTSGEISEFDAFDYLKVLRGVYLPAQSEADIRREEEEEEEARGRNSTGGTMSFREFKEAFSSPVKGFDLLDTILTLEQNDRIRHSGLACAVCAYTLVGLRYKEMNLGFSLCSLCYSEGKVPQEFRRDTYVFKELRAENRIFPERFRLVGNGSPKGSTTQQQRIPHPPQAQSETKQPNAVAAH